MPDLTIFLHFLKAAMTQKGQDSALATQEPDMRSNADVGLPETI